MNVTGKVSPDGKTIVLSWPEDDSAHEYVYTIDGDEHLIDGKRHFTFDGTTHSAPIGVKQDAQPHAYGVEALKIADSGAFVYDPTAVPPPPPPPPPPSRTVIAVYDFESGFGHWQPQDSTHGGPDQAGTDAHCEIVAAPPGFPLTKALQCRVMADSVRPPNPQGKHTTRAQGNLDPAVFTVHEGDEVWLEWKMLFPSDPALNNGPWNGGNIIWQWGAGNGPQIVLSDLKDGKGPMLELASAFTKPPRDHFRFAKLVSDHGFKVNLHAIISVDPAKGMLELDLDDAKVIPPVATQTLYGGGQDFNFDMYRSDSPAQAFNTTVIFSALTRYKP